MATDSLGSDVARDHVDIEAWVASLPATLLEQEIGEQFADSEFTTAGDQDIAGITTTATFNMILRVASGEGFQDNLTASDPLVGYVPANGVALRRTGPFDGGAAIAVAVNNLIIDGMQIDGLEEAAINDSRGSSLNVRYQNLIMETDNSSVSGVWTPAGATATTKDGILVNSLLIQRSTTGPCCAAFDTVLIINCNLLAPQGSTGAAFVQSSGNAGFESELINTAVFGFDDFLGADKDITVTNCGTDLSSTGSTDTVTDTLVSLTFADQFEDIVGGKGLEDWREKTGADLVDAGLSSADNDNEDILGTTRPIGADDDIGCWELPAAAGGADTKAKRFSMLNFGTGTTIHLLPDPDASIDLPDKQHLLDCYSGIAFEGGGTLFFTSHSVTVTFSAANDLKAEISRAATATFSAALTIKAIIARAATATFSGASAAILLLLTSHAATATFSGAHSLIAQILRATTATFTGANTLLVAIVRAATATFAAAATLMAKISRAATATFSGVNAVLQVSTTTHAATVTFSAALAVKAQIARAATVTFSAALTLRAILSRAATVTFTGASTAILLLLTSHAATVTISAASALKAKILRAATVTFSTAHSFVVFIARAATVTFAPASTATAVRKVSAAATATFTGARGLLVRIARAASLIFSGLSATLKIRGAGPLTSEFFKGEIRDASFAKGTITDTAYGKGKMRDAQYGKGGLE